MINGKILVEKLLKYAIKNLHLDPRDVVYTRNILLREFDLDCPAKETGDLSFIDKLSVPDILVNETIDFAKENKIVEDGEEERFATYIMGILSPLPSKVNQEFFAKKEFILHKGKKVHIKIIVKWVVDILP